MKKKKKPGLNSILYIRVTPELIAEIDEVLAQEKASHPGRTVSRADVARELIHEALAARRSKS